MTKQTEEALKMAIEALEDYPYEHRTAKMDDALQACKDALEQPAQEPVAERFLMKDKGKSYWAYSDYDNSKDWQPLYTHPAPSWQGLSDDEKLAIIRKWKDARTMREQELIGLGDAFEQALKEKNT